MIHHTRAAAAVAAVVVVVAVTVHQCASRRRLNCWRTPIGFDAPGPSVNTSYTRVRKHTEWPTGPRVVLGRRWVGLVSGAVDDNWANTHTHTRRRTARARASAERSRPWRAFACAPILRCTLQCECVCVGGCVNMALLTVMRGRISRNTLTVHPY